MYVRNGKIKSEKEEDLFIGVSGNICAGKTYLCKVMESPRYGYTAHFECISDNPILEKFYGDQEKYAFALQIFFLNKRFKSAKEISKLEGKHLQDRTIYEDHVFARVLCDNGTLEEKFYNIYKELFDNMMLHVRYPDFFIYLDVDPAICLKRVAIRSGKEERDCSSLFI